MHNEDATKFDTKEFLLSECFKYLDSLCYDVNQDVKHRIYLGDPIFRVATKIWHATKAKGKI